MSQDLQRLEEIRKGIKIPKKIRRDMPFDTVDLESLIPANITFSTEISLASESVSISHLVGKYERYYHENITKNIIRDTVNIKTDGKVLVRSPRGLSSGMAEYTLNSVLSIKINAFNDAPFNEQISCYVGRYTFDQISCLYCLTLSVNADNIPYSRYEILVPVADGVSSLPEIFVPESMSMFKLEKKYPNLFKYLMPRTMQSLNRVDW
jgi:hypothetical protein